MTQKIRFTQADRQGWMGILARSDADQLAALFGPDLPPHQLLRAPEIGTVMVQARVAVTGAPFNLGEMVITRAAVELPCGTVGHAQVQGRSKPHALMAALVDAQMQTEDAPHMRAKVLDPLASAAAQVKANRAAHAAATKVEFFTLVRGEDA
ncbi:MAG: phosphonate C-P lyase system protein PhnG [Paracoccaceae bacterium]|jgi:alpha-D-ribose 1-methylphosphonate 5-triphosphate synthase subunit PhnG|nr:phosphonate C-P lyase system protein PhnG [Paracoccaceae bacterium]MDO7654755.1 phosphonate C-P lyase system protein PhnG [Paracoccaceae bacterium]NQV67454.1 phosphonate C-P lyase system protein PhnG [Paracoccaceae bacterium]